LSYIFYAEFKDKQFVGFLLILVKLQKNMRKKNRKIIFFFISIIIVGLFSCCIDWSHVVEHDPLKTLEENITENERFSQCK